MALKPHGKHNLKQKKIPKYQYNYTLKKEKNTKFQAEIPNIHAASQTSIMSKERLKKTIGNKEVSHESRFNLKSLKERKV